MQKEKIIEALKKEVEEVDEIIKAIGDGPLSDYKKFAMSNQIVGLQKAITTIQNMSAYNIEEHYTPLNEKERISDDDLKSKIDEITEKKFDCELCEDTGEVTTDEQVYPGEPHIASIGSRKCICKLPDPDDYQEQE